MQGKGKGANGKPYGKGKRRPGGVVSCMGTAKTCGRERARLEVYSHARGKGRREICKRGRERERWERFFRQFLKCNLRQGKMGRKSERKKGKCFQSVLRVDPVRNLGEGTDVLARHS